MKLPIFTGKNILLLNPKVRKTKFRMVFRIGRFISICRNIKSAKRYSASKIFEGKEIGPRDPLFDENLMDDKPQRDIDRSTFNSAFSEKKELYNRMRIGLALFGNFFGFLLHALRTFILPIRILEKSKKQFCLKGGRGKYFGLIKVENLRNFFYFLFLEILKSILWN